MLQQLEVKILKDDDCGSPSKWWGTFLNRSMTCAQAIDPTSATCQVIFFDKRHAMIHIHNYHECHRATREVL